MRKILTLLGVLACGPALAEGGFVGLGGHAAKGGVELVEGESGWEIHLGADFAVDPGGKTALGFMKDGAFVEEAKAGDLAAASGAQVYDLPEGVEPADYDRLVIYCYIEAAAIAEAVFAATPAEQD